MRPSVCARWTSAAGPSGVERSTATWRASPTPGPVPLRPEVTTRAPSSARSCAVARPIPPVDPVTTQRRSPRPRSTSRRLAYGSVTTILLARHGETDWNRDQRFQGHGDPPLNDHGREQARNLAVRFAADPEPLAAIYASTLRRARETAKIVGEHLGLHVETHDGLREVDLGSWSGLTRAEVEHAFPEGFRRWLDF